MITVSGSFFINGLRETGSTLKTQIKNISSLLVHIGSVTNTGIDCSRSPVSFYPPKQSPAPETKLTATFEPLLANFQPRSEKHPIKKTHQTVSVKKRRAPLPPTQKSYRTPLPPLSSALITQLEQTIERDKQSAAWYARYNSPGVVLKPTRPAPLPPLSEQLITRLEQMIESDRQSPERALMTDLKQAIKDVQFNMQMRKIK